MVVPLRKSLKEKQQLERNRKDNGGYGTINGFLLAVLLEMPIRAPNSWLHKFGAQNKIKDILGLLDDDDI